MIKYSDLLPIVKHTNECDNPNELTSTLLGFQKAAVNWMLLSETSYKPLPLWIPHDGQFKHIYTDEVKPQMTWKHNGGILADEMGLGKTLMAISLILLHKAPHVCPNPATLIITPISILYQWIQEIETHCPTLKLLHYKGSTPAINFCEYDVVLVSIETCRKEIHFARPRSSMKRRREPVFNYPMSPLVNVTWWRVILDEAQLMGSFASLAYEMGMRIPRTNVWVVTGTPCPSGDFKDIYPLLHFIGIGEYFKARTDNLAALVDSLSYYMHANTKTNVGNELVLPNQRDERLFMDFDRVESVHYKDLWHQALNTIKVKHETYKTALMSNNHSKDLEKALEKAHEELLNAMKSWSLRMRQTCCHPQLSTHNQRTLGNSIMTMSSVLAFMIKAATSEWYSNRRLLILENIRHAQLLELQGQLEKSLQIYQSQQKEIGQELQILLESADFCESDDDQSDAEGEGIESSQQRVRSWRILEHAIYFFIASNYHNQQALLDQNDKLKSTIEAYETQNYKIAADKRSLILARYEANFKRSLDKEIENPQVPFLETQFTGGILSHVVFDDLHSLFDTLNDQCAVIDEWRSKIINNISKPLDHEDQATGDEFINSVETQDEGMIYQDLYSQMISARRYLIAGTKSLFPTIKCGKNQKLMAQELSKYQKYPQSFKGALGELTKLKSHHYSSESEIQLIDYAIKNLNELYQNQLKAQVKLEGIQYYIQLNKISDSVVFPDFGDDIDSMILANRAKKRALNELIAKNAMKRRYLENLVAKNVRVCPICTCEHDQGLVTKCGHFFCMDCGNAWFAKNRRCPTCNQSNHLSELARVSQREDENSQNVNNLEKHVSKVPINGQFGTKVDALIRHIKSLQIENPQVKVLIFSQWELLLSIISKALSENNIGFVNIDGQASQPGHGAIKLSKGQSAVEFRNNPYITAFILNSKSQSAGLTLVSATHVFLIEHLLTQGLEKQAINRVHRIGQTKETNVWHYYIRGTIEESILKLQEMESNESELSRLIKLFPYDDGTVLT